MKKSLQIIIFVISCIAISSVTTIVIFRFIPAVKKSFDTTGTLDTFIFILTLIVAVLAFMFAFIGYNEFTRVIEYRKKVDDFEKSFNEKLKTHHQNVIDINNRLTQQSRYFDQTISYLFQVAYLSIEQMEDHTLSEQLLENLFHELQIARLYRTNLNKDESQFVDINKIAALEYLVENGTMDDITHLQYVEQHDPNEHIRRRAIEVRAIIQNRNNNQGNTTPPVVT